MSAASGANSSNNTSAAAATTSSNASTSTTSAPHTSSAGDQLRDGSSNDNSHQRGRGGRGGRGRGRGRGGRRGGRGGGGGGSKWVRRDASSGDSSGRSQNAADAQHNNSGDAQSSNSDRSDHQQGRGRRNRRGRGGGGRGHSSERGRGRGRERGRGGRGRGRHRDEIDSRDYDENTGESSRDFDEYSSQGDSGENRRGSQRRGGRGRGQGGNRRGGRNDGRYRDRRGSDASSTVNTEEEVGDGASDGRGGGRRQNYRNGGDRRQRGGHHHQHRQRFAESYDRRRDDGDGDAGDEAQQKSSSKHLSRIIEDKLRRKVYDCMICMGNISPYAPTWTCKNCWAIFHHKCMREWVRTSGVGQSWRCPGCQYINTDSLGPYRCFCDKLKKPDYNHFLCPHSCGEPCERSRPGSCPHLCTALCHPGPCPPCKRQGPVLKCACGKTEYRVSCGADDSEQRTCEAACGKMLSCGKHRCAATCHAGACKPCELTELQDCFCGRQKQEARPCGSGELVPHADDDDNATTAAAGGDEDAAGTAAAGDVKAFSCDRPCAKKLNCGKHECKRMCHSGPCEPCARKPSFPQRCACGRNMLNHFAYRSNCLAPLPTCDEVCGKPLDGCEHTCPAECHDSECPPCKVKVSVNCRCGNQKKTMRCHEHQKWRTKLRSEQKESNDPLHDGEHFTCRTVCKTLLSCNSHRCKRVCCPGRKVAHSPFHFCEIVCNKPLNCGKHLCSNFCHLGFCDPCAVVVREGLSCACGAENLRGFVPCGTAPPECSLPCKRPRDCEHPCPNTCHQGECPPCSYLVEKECVGGHRFRVANVPCHAKNVSCGQRCLKTRVCGKHLCMRSCHGGPCDAVGAKPGSSCGQPCGQKLARCDHICKQTCHPDRPCPDARCVVPMLVTCECQRNKRHVPCADVVSMRMLRCTEQCAVEQRNERLRQALQLDSHGKLPGTIDSEQAAPWSRFSRELLERGAERPEFVRRQEGQLAKFVEEPENSKFLPSMNAEKRWFVHQLAPHYGLMAESMDSGKNRAVSLTKTFRPQIPAYLLSQALVDMNRQTPAQARAAREWPSGCVLAIGEVGARYTDDRLRVMLSSQFSSMRIVRLDRASTFLVFMTPSMMLEALDAFNERFPSQVFPASIRDEQGVKHSLDQRQRQQQASAPASGGSGGGGSGGGSFGSQMTVLGGRGARSSRFGGAAPSSASASRFGGSASASATGAARPSATGAAASSSNRHSLNDGWQTTSKPKSKPKAKAARHTDNDDWDA